MAENQDHVSNPQLNGEVRTLQKEDLDESIRLDCFAFQNEHAFSGSEEQRLQFMEESKALLKPEQIWGYFVEGVLASKMVLLPLQVNIMGKLYDMGGVAGVATWPEHRYGGMVAQLLLNALFIMKEKRQAVSFLHPFSIAFYRRYGWEVFTDQKKYIVESAQVPKFAPSNGRIVRVDKDIAHLNGIYEQYARNYSGTLKREEDWWRNRIFKRKSGHTAVYYNEEGEPRGYILYIVKEMQMTVHELVFLDEEARLALWHFIGKHHSMFDTMTLAAPMDDQLAYLLDNPRIQQEIYPYCMSRIVDVPVFLELYPFEKSEERQTFLLSIEDRYAPWNQGDFEVEVTLGQARVKKLVDNADNSAEGYKMAVHDQQRKEDGQSGTLSCGIQSLSAMMMGYQTPAFLYSIGRLNGDIVEVKRWAAMIPKKTTYLMDFF